MRITNSTRPFGANALGDENACCRATDIEQLGRLRWRVPH